MASSGEITDPCPVPTSLTVSDPVFQHARLKPFTDQVYDARVADPVLQETDEPFLADRVEEALDVGVENLVHLGAADPDHEGIQRVVLVASRAETIREAEEIFLVDPVQHCERGPLDDLVFQGRHTPSELHSNSIDLWDLPRSSTHFTRCTASGSLF